MRWQSDCSCFLPSYSACYVNRIFVCSFAAIVKSGELQRSFVSDPVGLYHIAGGEFVLFVT
ncbi:hypothetical protein SLEP1_g38806 [Rubroshorea leprosula]|uniref:Uncharacterized protein n=1 Tax=Rubroshorea leprosula TaxID=152421 RepID=A0AAV5KY67_9ROSI|nr:hypothetical protein SLEP1_g38806 [Rubroshorea leprosula]